MHVFHMPWAPTRVARLNISNCEHTESVVSKRLVHDSSSLPASSAATLHGFWSSTFSWPDGAASVVILRRLHRGYPVSVSPLSSQARRCVGIPGGASTASACVGNCLHEHHHHLPAKTVLGALRERIVQHEREAMVYVCHFSTSCRGARLAEDNASNRRILDQVLRIRGQGPAYRHSQWK